MSPDYEYQDRQGGGVVLPNGVYPWEIIKALDTTSKGLPPAPQIKMSVRLHGGENGDGLVYEYLTFSDAALWRVDQFINSAGCAPAVGTRISISARDVVGWTGMARVFIGRGPDVYDAAGNARPGPERNEIKEWIKADPDAQPSTPNAQWPGTPAAVGENLENQTDDLPF